MIGGITTQWLHGDVNSMGNKIRVMQNLMGFSLRGTVIISFDHTGFL